MKAKEIRITGGGSKSAAWRQIMADVFGVPVVAMVEDEGAALGGALQAAWCLALQEGRRKTKLSDLTARVVAVDEASRCRPNAARVARYRELQDLQDRVSCELRTLFSLQRRFALNDVRPLITPASGARAKPAPVSPAERVTARKSTGNGNVFDRHLRRLQQAACKVESHPAQHPSG